MGKSYDTFGHSDEWLDGYDAGRRAERYTFWGFLISEGIIAPDKDSSALYDAENAEKVRLSLIEYVDMCALYESGKKKRKTGQKRKTTIIENKRELYSPINTLFEKYPELDK